MSSEWQEFQLDEICEFVNGFAFKPESYIDKSADTYEVFRMGYISRGGGFKEDSSPVFVSRSNPKLDKYRLRQGDIIIAMTDMKDKVAILGNTARVPEDNRFVLNQRAGLIRVSRPDLVCPVFLYYYSNWKPHVDYLRARANSGVQVNLSTGAIKEAKVFLPSVSEQRLIGEVLSSFDDRITLLRETNVTLEAIAQALFKSWFVNFDPVRAKMEGRVPEGMDEDTAALFPDSFEESELGLVPMGWRVGTLGDVLKISYGKNLPTNKLLPDGYPVYGGNGQIGFFDRYIYETRQVLVACRGAASGKVNQSAPKSFVTNNSLVLESDHKTELPFGFLKFYMLNSDLTPFVTGSAQPQVTIDNLKVLRLMIPSAELLRSFESTSSTLEDKIAANLDQIQTLSSLRDTLLPRLISGQLSLSDS